MCLKFNFTLSSIYASRSVITVCIREYLAIRLYICKHIITFKHSMYFEMGRLDVQEDQSILFLNLPFTFEIYK